jgi:hypothetical protein
VNPDLANLLAVVLLALVLCVGVGCALALLRVILPGLARAADRSLGGLGATRLFVSGVLPLVGALVLAAVLADAGAPHGLVLVVWAPLLLLAVGGATAGVPHVGERLLRRGAEASLLARAVAGGLVVGLAMATWMLPPLGLLVTLLVAGWLVGIGLGLWRRNSA